MFKILILVFLLFLSLSQALAKVEVRWFSVASLVLEDEDTQIFFDPMFTRAGLKHWLGLSEFRSDTEMVNKVLKENNLSKVKGLFASHSHFDHVIDAPAIAALTAGIFYVDENSERIAKAYRDPKIQTHLFKNLEKIQIGKFTVTVIKRKHSHIPILRSEWLPGPVPEDFNFGFYDYHVGDTWFYYVEHPEGKILVDQGSEPYVKDLTPFTQSVDVIIQGIANRSGDEAILEGYTKALNPKMYMPTHFDNFFFPFSPKDEISFLPGVKFEEIMSKFREKYPKVNLVVPEYGKKIELFK